jgi:exonuclease III
MILASQNCKGLVNMSKEESLRDLIRAEKPIVVLIQETKLEEKEVVHVGKIQWRSSEGTTISSRGASRGI